MLTLPGNVQAREEAVIYGRINGFVRKWNVDIGDRVKKGAIMATIDAPEKQQADQMINNYNAAQNDYRSAVSTVAANSAAAERLRATLSFKQVRSPFNGIVTARNVNTGDLITAGSTNATTQMFMLSQFQASTIRHTTDEL